MTQDLTDTPLQGAIQRDFPRNAAVMVVWDAIWALGMSLCLFTSVAPAYLLWLGAPKWVVQSAMVGFSAITILQLFAGRLAQRPWRKLVAFGTWALYATCWLVYGIVAWLGWGYLPKEIWVPLFLLTMTGLAICNHVGLPITAGLVLENTPLRQRGLLVAMRTFALGLCGLGGSFGARWLMGQWPPPTNFHFAFIVGATIFLVSCLPFLCAFRDNAQRAYPAQNQQTRLRDAIGILWHNFGFRVFLFFFTLVVAAQSLAPMLIAYGRDTLGMTDADVARFTLMWFVAAIAIGPTVPRLADRYGFRLVGTFCAAFLVAAFACPLLLRGNKEALFAAYACYAASASLTFVLVANLGAELVPEVNPAIIIAFGLTAVMPVSVAIAPLTGLLVDVYGTNAYPVVFLLGGLLGFFALLGFTGVVREPRTRQPTIYERIRRT